MKYYFCIFFCFFCLFPFAKAQNLNELILSGPENSKDEIAEEQNISVPKSNFWNRGFYDFSICAGKTNYKGLDKDFVNSTPEGDVPSIGLAATRFASLFCQKISVEAKMIPASEDNVSKFTGISTQALFGFNLPLGIVTFRPCAGIGVDYISSLPEKFKRGVAVDASLLINLSKKFSILVSYVSVYKTQMWEDECVLFGLNFNL